MTPNERIIRTFADQFTPPLKVIRSERINNIKMPDAWTANYWNGEKSIGVTAVAHSNGLHAFIEAAGTGDIAEHAGQIIAKALGLFEENTTPPDQAA